MPTEDKKRQKVALEMLERYTGSSPNKFHPFILLTNFDHYFQVFSKMYKAKVEEGSVMAVAHSTSAKVSMINFRIGAPTAALVMDIISYIQPKAVLMLGMCGGLHPKVKVGDFILPMAAIRDEGTSSFYMPDRIPALPTFRIQKILSEVLGDRDIQYKTGVVHTTDYRFWEFDQKFRSRLVEERTIVIDMECAAIFVAGFGRRVPIGALLLVSDLPLKRGGIKSVKSSLSVFKNYSKTHLEIGVKTLSSIQHMRDEINLRQFQW